MTRVRTVGEFIRRYAPWLLVAWFIWWYVFDNAPAVRMDYQHPVFLSTPVTDRSQITPGMEVQEAPANARVYRYIEWCLLRDVPSQIRKTWSNGIQFQVPPVSGTQRLGCFKRSISEQVPPIPGHQVNFEVKTAFDINPLKTQVHKFAPIPLKVTP